MVYNRRKKKMKKIVLAAIMLTTLLTSAMVFSAFTTSKQNVKTDCITQKSDCTGDCNFQVTDATPSISGTTVKITVTVRPAFTPTSKGTWRVVVSPNGPLSSILDSQSKSVVFNYTGSTWKLDKKTVDFYCSVEDNSFRECRNNSFQTSCYQE